MKFPFKRKPKFISRKCLYSAAVKRRLKLMVDTSEHFSPCRSALLNDAQKACIRVIDQRNLAHAARILSLRADHSIIAPARYSTTQIYRRKRMRAVKRALARYSHLYVLYKAKLALQNTIGIINRAQGKNFGDHGHQFRRLYVDLFINKTQVEFQLDSGADANLISKDILDNIYPNWKNQPHAGDITLNSASENKIKVIETRWLPASLTKEATKLHKFVIVKHK